MAVRIKFDNNHVPLRPTFVLANRNGNKLGCIPAININFSDKFNGASELQFRVYKDENGHQCELWDEIVDFKLLWCPEWDQWFEIHVELNEADSVIKIVSATSVGESELSQINLYNIEINTKDDIDREDYVATVLYNETNPKASLLDRITDKAPHYHIGHVDDTIANIQRTFQFDDISILDALHQIGEEIQCIFIIDSGTAPDGKIARSINAYDLQSNCNSCGHRDAFVGVCPKCGSSDISTGYGQDTNIYISKENLTDEITYTSNTDSVKNCFRLVGGDDLMTATIANCNPNGGGYLWYFSDEMKADMSDTLLAKLDEYENEYNEYVDSHNFNLNSSVLSSYNTLVNKYKYYKSSLCNISNPISGYSNLMKAYYDTIDFEMLLKYELMPSVEISGTTAAQELAKLTSVNLSPVAVTNVLSCSSATASSAVLYVAKQLVRSDYQVKVEQGILHDNVIWTGRFIVTNYSDDADTATSDSDISVTITDDKRTYIEQRINKTLSNKRDDITDIIALFKLDLIPFEAQLKNYSLLCLNSIRDSCQSCMDILIEQLGITDSNPTGNSSLGLYNSMYLPYYNKLNKIIEEVALRENEIEIVCGTFDENGGILEDGMQTIIQSINKQVQDYLDFDRYIGTSLVNELAAYRREDTYENDNYVSDGLDNNDIFQRALEFIELAKVEIFKSATLQHSISSTLKNLLVMKEFSSITNLFEVGNWLSIRVADKSYRLRLSSYEIDYESIDNISVEFSDVVETMFGSNDVESVIKSASSMSSSFGYVKRQARRGDQSHATLTDYKENGLALTQMKIISDAENQNVTMDHHGLLCREKVPYNEEYDDQQLKIINKGLYLTDDGWRTSRAGIGEFIYYDPDDGEYKTKYGVVADMLIAPLILSEDVGIYNLNNTIRLNKNGLTIVSTGNSADSTVFQIQSRKTVSGEDVIENVIYFDTNGNAYFNGRLTLQSLVGNRTVSQLLSDVDATITQVDVEYASNQSSSTAPTTGWSTSAPQWQEGYYVWQRTATTTANGTTYSSPTCISGRDGVSAYVYELNCSPSSLIKQTDGTISPSSVAFSITRAQGTGLPTSYSGRFIVEEYNGSSWTTKYTSSSNESSHTYTPTSTATMIRATAYLAGGTTTQIDTQSIPIVSNGSSGSDGYTVLLNNESHVFAATTSAAIAGSTSSSVIAFKGTTQIAATIGTITGQVSGLTTSISNNGTTTASFTVNVTTSLTTRQGELTIPVTVDGKSYSLRFSWALALTGAQGDQGDSGIGVSNIVEQYYLSTSDQTQTGGSWGTAQPVWESGKYIWTRSLITWTNNTTSTTTPVLAQAINGANSAVNQLNTALNQQEIFNRLTNNGQSQGLYFDNGLLYISADYIGTGHISANLIQGGTIDGTTVNAKLLNIVDNSNNVIASFGDTIILGNSSDAHAEMDYNSFQLFDRNQNEYLSMGDLRDSNMQCTITEKLEVYEPQPPAGHPEWAAKYCKLTYIPTDGLSSILSVKNGNVVISSYESVSDDFLFFDLNDSSVLGGDTVDVTYTTSDPVYYYNLGTRNRQQYAGAYSVIEGMNTSAEGVCSHAEGRNTYAKGSYSHVEGYGTTASYPFQHVVGMYNAEDSTAIEIVGYGEGSSGSNIRTLKKNGNHWIAGSYSSSSDMRLKTECGDIPDMSKIQARLFKWNKDKPNRDDKEHIGYFAQDVEDVAPYLVDEDAMGYKSLDYNGVLVAKIASLERRVAELEEMISAIKLNNNSSNK